MRVAPRELRGVRRDGVLVRFAMLGPVAYVEVEVPPEGSGGTGLEAPSRDAGWGFVLRGDATLHGRVTRTLLAGTAFYIPPGTPDHWLTATGSTVIAGFAPVAPDLDASDSALQAQGFEMIAPPAESGPLPAAIRAAEPSSTFHEPGSIDVETAQMGAWVFMRTVFGPLSGFTSGWCDLPHWGLVLRGDLAVQTEDGVELLTAGDVYYYPPGPPGHQFHVPDTATTIDYTPVDEVDAAMRRAAWRQTAWPREAAGGDPERTTLQPVPAGRFSTDPPP